MADTGKDKIVLCVPGSQRIQIGAITHLPLALLSLAAWLRDKEEYAGRIKLIDGQLKKITADDFRDAAVIGITAMTGNQIKYGLEIGALARLANPDAVMVWGGIHPSLLPKKTAQHPLVDVVVVGEGEQTFLEVVNAIFEKRAVAGIPGTCVQKKDGEVVFGPTRPFIDLADLPLPAYDLVNVDEYQGIEYQFDYQSSRGCPFRCGFCYNTVFCGRRYRKKPPEKVWRELSYLQEKFQVVNFGLVDDEFFIDRKRVEEIFDRIIASGMDFGIIASCRLDIVCRFTPDFLKKMKSAGISQMFFGAESGSNYTLTSINKDISTHHILEGAKKVAEAGIRPILSFMSGFPGETMVEFQKTLDLIRELWGLHPLITVNGIFPFNAYPGTMLYEKAVALGLETPSSLEEWGEWHFQYEPDHPWLNSNMKRQMEISFYMVRFKYYVARYEDRYKGKPFVKLIKLAVRPFRWSINFRLTKRFFAIAWEWKLFALLVRKTFGYL